MMKREVDKILKPGETVELVVYPQWRWLSQANTISVLFAVVWLGIIGKLTSVMFSLEKDGEWITLFLLLLPFWAAGIGVAISPFWRRKRVNNTLYVVTNRRAIIAQPTPFLLKPETRTWYLEAGLVKSVYAQSDGCGDIVFDYRKVRTKHGWRDVPEGFLSVPELDRVNAMLQELIAAAGSQPEAAAPTPEAPWTNTYLPPVPPRKRASWKWGFVLISPGLVLLIASLLLLQNHYKIAKHGVTTQAHVIHKEQGVFPALKFSFYDAEGKKHHARTSWGSSALSVYRPGDTVNICYMPYTPSRVTLANHQPDDFLFPGLWLIGIGGASLWFWL